MPDYNLGRARGKIEIDVDRRGIRRAEGALDDLATGAHDMAQEFEGAEKASTKFERQTSKTRKEVVALTDETDDLVKKQRELEKVTNDLEEAEQELARATERGTKSTVDNLKQQERVRVMREQQKKLLREIIALEDESEAGTRKITRAIQTLGQAVDDIPDVKRIEVDVDNGRALRSLGDVQREVRAVQSLARVTTLGFVGAQGIGALGGGLGLLGGGLTGFGAQGIFGIAGAISDMAGAFGLLPGVIGAATVATQTMKLATHGLGDAMSAAADGDVEKFIEKIKELSPAAQMFSTEIFDLMPTLKNFQRGLQESLISPLVEVPRMFTENLLPIIEGPLQQLMGTFGRTGRNLADWLVRPEQITVIERFLDNTTKGFEILFEAAEPLAEAISSIMDVSGSFLPLVGQELADAIREINKFVQTAVDNGEFAAWIHTGIQSVKQFGSILKDFGLTFVYIGRVAEQYGGGALGWLEKISTQLLKWTQSARGQEELHEFFDKSTKAADALAPVLGTLLTIITQFGSHLADLGIRMAPAIDQFFKLFGDALDSLMVAFINAEPAISQFLVAFGVTLSNAFRELAPILPRVLQALTDIFTVLFSGGGFGDLIEALGLGIANVAEWLRDNLVKIQDAVTAGFADGDWGPLLSMLESIFVPIGGSIIGWMITAVREAMPKIVEVAIEVVTSMAQGIADNFDTFLNIALPVVKDAGKEMVRALAEGMVEGIPLVGGPLGKVLQFVLDHFPNSPAKRGPMRRMWPEKIGHNMIGQMADGIAGATGALSGAASDAAGAVIGGLGQYGRGGDHALAGMVEDLLEMTGLARKFVDVFSKVSGIVFDALKFFTTNPATGESILPKRFVRTVSDRDLQRRREDKAFRDSSKKSRAPADRAAADLALPQDANRQQIADYIIRKAMSEGYSREQANQFVIQAFGESGLNPNASNPAGWEGIFQFDRPTWEQAGGGDMHDAKQNIDNYFRLAEQRGLTPSSFTQGSQLGTQVSIGGPWHPENAAKGHLAAAKEGAQQYIDAFNGEVANQPLPVPGVDPSKPVGSVDTPANSAIDAIAAIAADMGLELTSSVRPGDPGHHGVGEAGDFSNSSGPTPEMRRFADYMATNFGHLIEELIYDDDEGFANLIGGGQNVTGTGYYSDNTLAGHRNHVHIAVTDENVNAILTALGQGLPPESPSNRSGDGSTRELLDAARRGELTDTSGLQDKTLGVQEQMLEELRGQNASLDEAIRIGQDPNATDQQIADSLSTIDQNIATLRAQDTPQSRAQAQALEGIQSSIMGDRGFGPAQNPIDTAQTIAQGATSIASNVFSVIEGWINAVGATAEITDTLVRGIKNTEDIMNLIDQVQVFIDLGAKIAGAVSSITGTIAGIVGAAGGADPSGGASGAATALQGVSAIAGMVQAGLETTNAMIDLGQEVYRIASKYVARFLAFWIGGPGGSMFGDIKFLLDETDNTLKAWSDENPDDKRSRSIPGFLQSGEQTSGGRIRDLNVYVGPGTDPAESLNTAMWMVQTDRGGVFTSEF